MSSQTSTSFMPEKLRILSGSTLKMLAMAIMLIDHTAVSYTHLSANNITLRVGKKALFEDVNIKFTEGNCYGLIGANGAGKSTFLKILSGQLEPTKGDIVITPGQRLSFLQQDHFKYDAYTVLDTVIMGNLRLYAVSYTHLLIPLFRTE